jgi:hypothetical protein
MQGAEVSREFIPTLLTSGPKTVANSDVILLEHKLTPDFGHSFVDIGNPFNLHVIFVG